MTDNTSTSDNHNTDSTHNTRKKKKSFLCCGSITRCIRSIFSCCCCCCCRRRGHSSSNNNTYPSDNNNNNEPFSNERGSDEDDDDDDAADFVEVDVLRPDLNAPRGFPSNAIHTAKYTALTGVPLSLLYQFRKVSNVYFLLVMIISLVPGASPINPFSSVAPLCIVLGAGMIKDLWEDWKRRKADSVANNMEVHVLRHGAFVAVKSREVTPGDVLLIRLGEEVKADCLVLNTSLPDGLTYIETANLDGETNAKTRRAKIQTVEQLGTVEDIVDVALHYSPPQPPQQQEQQHHLHEENKTDGHASAAGGFADSAMMLHTSNSTADNPHRGAANHGNCSKSLNHACTFADTSSSHIGRNRDAANADEHLWLQSSTTTPQQQPLYIHQRFRTIDERMEAEGTLPVPTEILGLSKRFEEQQQHQHSRSVSFGIDHHLHVAPTSSPVGEASRHGSAPASPTTSAVVRGVVILGSAPSPDLAAWFGQVRFPNGELAAVGIDQFLPRGCIIRNTEWVLAAVLYTGKQTKMLLNLRPKPYKTTLMARRLNILNIFLFVLNQVLMFILCGLAIHFKHKMLEKEEGVRSGYSAWYIQWNLTRYADGTLFWWRYLTNFVLLSYLIPMSLYVTLEFNKAMQMLMIGADKRMAVYDEFTGKLKKSRPKTSELNCQLGQVQYIFTDKTGTLTENLMTYVGGFVSGIAHDERIKPGGLGKLFLRHVPAAAATRRKFSTEGSTSLPQTPRRRIKGPPSYTTSPDTAATASCQLSHSKMAAESSSTPQQMFLMDDEERELEKNDLFLYLRSLALCHSVVCFSSSTTAEEEEASNKGDASTNGESGVDHAPTLVMPAYRGGASTSTPQALPLLPSGSSNNYAMGEATTAANGDQQYHHSRTNSRAGRILFIPNAVPAAPKSDAADMRLTATGESSSLPLDERHMAPNVNFPTTALLLSGSDVLASSADWGHLQRQPPYHLNNNNSNHQRSSSAFGMTHERTGSRALQFPGASVSGTPTLPAFGGMDSPQQPPHHQHHHGRTLSMSRQLHGRTGSVSWYSHRYNVNALHQRTATQASLNATGTSINPLEEKIDRSALYEGQSLDEIALVSAARENGFSLLQRTAKQMFIQVMGSRVLCYDIIAELEFTPQRKLMSILLQRNPSGDSLEAAQKAAEVTGSAHYHRAGHVPGAADSKTKASDNGKQELPNARRSGGSGCTLNNENDDEEEDDYAASPLERNFTALPIGSPAAAADTNTTKRKRRLSTVSIIDNMDNADGSDEAKTHALPPLLPVSSSAIPTPQARSSPYGIDLNINRVTAATRTATNNNNNNTNTSGVGNNASGTTKGDSHKQQQQQQQQYPIMLLVKGADSSMMDIVDFRRKKNNELRPVFMKQLESMASEGLRTLVLGQRYVSEKELREWLPVYTEAQCAMTRRNERLHEAYALIERDIDLIGTTAVEDKLQDGVPETLAFLSDASIVVWMLTGDKRETAVTIAHTSGLVDSDSAHAEDVMHLDVSDLLTRAAQARQSKKKYSTPSGSPTTNTTGGAAGARRDRRDYPKAATAQHCDDPQQQQQEAPTSSSLEREPTFDSNQHTDSSVDDGQQHPATAEELAAMDAAVAACMEEQLCAAEARCAAVASHASDASPYSEEGPTSFSFSSSSATQQQSKKRVVIVVDGKTLDYIFKDNALSHRFFLVGSQCRSAVCCRMTPLQKAQIVRIFQKNMKAVALAIGDGANDVSMIQEAKIGIGIMGLEGSQAELASDYAIPKFRFLKRLLMVHGRFSIYREAHCILYSLYKNIVVTIGQIGYAFYCGFSGQTFMDSWLLAMFSIFFCSLQPLMIGILDKDVEDELAESLPELYPPLSRENTYFSVPYILKWLSDGVVEGCLFFFFLMYTAAQRDDLFAWRSAGVEEYGTTFFTMLILVVDLRVGLIVTYYMILFAVAIILEIFMLPVLEVAYSAVHSLGGSNWCVWVAQELYGHSGKFYLMLFFAVGVLVVYTMATDLYVHMFAPWRSASLAMDAARASPYRRLHLEEKRELLEEYNRRRLCAAAQHSNKNNDNDNNNNDGDTANTH